MKSRDPFTGIATVDVMINLVLVFAVLLRLSIMIANTEAAQKKQAHTSANALYLVTVVWPGESNDDVDTYVRDPVGHLVYFRRLQDGLMCLTRDDTGADSNNITLPDRRVVKSEINKETVEIRGVIEGEYIVNCHMYRKDKENDLTKVHRNSL